MAHHPDQLVGSIKMYVDCCGCCCPALPCPALQAVSLTGRILGKSPLRVLPSKTAIVPVNKELMPRSPQELERCSRTVYVANIDKKVEREDVRGFFEHLCGEQQYIRAHAHIRAPPAQKRSELCGVFHSTRVLQGPPTSVGTCAGSCSCCQW